MRHWLMKSEPEVFSIADLKREGVRNYQARNFMQKDMQVGDKVLFYHSNASPSGVAGLAEVSALAVPDPTQFDKKSEYHEPKAHSEKPIWYCVEVKFVQQFARVLSLEELKHQAVLQDMLLMKKGQRLSVQPVTDKEFTHICKMGEKA